MRLFPARTIVMNEMALQIRHEYVIAETVLHDAVAVRQRLYFPFFRIKDPELPVSPDLIGMPLQIDFISPLFIHAYKSRCVSTIFMEICDCGFGRMHCASLAIILM